MNKHTHGPWKVVDTDDGIYAIIDENRKNVFHVASSISRLPDAQLIAAAPNMFASLHIALDALVKARANLDSNVYNSLGTFPVSVVARDAIEIIDRVITKAKGGV